MKKRSGKNLIRFFYHLLVVLVMAMPMLSGLVRVIYIQANQNAKDSYYGQTINESVTDYFDITSLTIHSTYKVQYIPRTVTNINGYNSIGLRVSHVKDFVNDISYSNINYIRFYAENNNTNYIMVISANPSSNEGEFASTQMNNIQFEYLGIYNSNTNTPWLIQDIFYNIFYNTFSYLDNAFDYSIWKTMQDFTFHSDFRFTDIANGILMTFDNNNLYIQYINFYINWLLTTAVICFAPYVLLSFYHFAIGILDKFMKKGEEL